MFTGIVREVGRVVSVAGGENGAALVVEAPESAPGVEVGGSVAIDGVCLTAESVEGTTISFHAVPETLRRSSLGKLVPDARVNLEPALRAGEPLGGHFVQGHVDGIGRIRGIEPDGDSVRVAVEAPEGLLRYCVAKGSITVAGVSLTVAAIGDDHFVVALIPHTLAVTTLGDLLPGREVNLEVDVIAKYVERLVGQD
jgi:riboflavin synthase